MTTTPMDQLAQRIMVHSLLEVIHRSEAGTERSATADEDELAMMDPFTRALGIGEDVAKLALQEYFAFKRGDEKNLQRALKEGERNEQYRRLHGLSFLIVTVGSNLARDADKWLGVATLDEYGARKYLDVLESRVNARRFAQGETNVVDFMHEGLSLGQVGALVDVLKTGDYGAFFGCPVDDTHLGSLDKLHPMEVFIPPLGTFMSQHYNKKPAGGFLSHAEGNTTPLLYQMLLSRAVQAEMANQNELCLDEKTHHQYEFTRIYLEPLIVSIFDISTSAVAEKVSVGTATISRHDMLIHHTISSVIKPMTRGRSIPPYAELQRLKRLYGVYEAIKRDARFSDSEHALADRMLELCGIRRQDTRDLLLNVTRDDETGVVLHQSADNLDKLYRHYFFRPSS